MVDLLFLYYILPAQTQVSVLKNKCYTIIVTAYRPFHSSFSLSF